MKKAQIIRALCVAMAFVATLNIAQAQFRQSIYLNGSLPTGSWTSKNISFPTITGVTFNEGVPLTPANMGKVATMGFGAGYRAQYLFDVGVGEVAPFANVDFLYNSIKSSVHDAYTQNNMTSTLYFNVPVFVGVSYLYDELFSDITLYGEAGIGADFFFMTGEGKSGNDLLWYNYKPTASIAGEFGIGAFFGRHFSAGINYYIMGEHTIDMTAKTAEKHPLEQDHYTKTGNRQTRTLGSLMLRVGFHL